METGGKPKIEIHHVDGDVVISQDQQGGVTSHTGLPNERKSILRKRWTLVGVITFVASIMTILGYFGLSPTSKKEVIKDEVSNQIATNQSRDRNTIRASVRKKEAKEGKVIGKKEDKQISIGNVTGDVVISQNQSGGITAHSVNVNQPKAPEWTLGQSEKTSNDEWRAKLSARGAGNLAYYNWNILLTLNTQVIRREDVPGEVTVGPWMPLSVAGGSLQPNHFFVGFSEFKPGQAFSIYLYTKEPIKVLKVDVLSQ